MGPSGHSRSRSTSLDTGPQRRPGRFTQKLTSGVSNPTSPPRLPVTDAHSGCLADRKDTEDERQPHQRQGKPPSHSAQDPRDRSQRSGCGRRRHRGRGSGERSCQPLRLRLNQNPSHTFVRVSVALTAASLTIPVGAAHLRSDEDRSHRCPRANGGRSYPGARTPTAYPSDVQPMSRRPPVPHDSGMSSRIHGQAAHGASGRALCATRTAHSARSRMPPDTQSR